MTELIVEIVVSLILALIAKYLVPWLKEKRIYGYAEKVVEALEQMVTEEGAGKEKYEKAKTWMLKKFKMSEEDAQRIIEAAVYNMKKSQK